MSSSQAPGPLGKFVVSANPETDLWRKPPSTDRNNAALKSLCTIPLEGFKSTRVSFTAAWARQYDQGGVALFFRRSGAQDQWIKSGIEFYQGSPFLSTVCTDSWSDWSLTPVTQPSRSSSPSEYVTIEARREGDELGKSLWVYQLLFDADGSETQRVPLRECNWVFASEEGVALEVAAYAARPAAATGSDDVLDVEFGEAVVEKR